jgi:hypothetical protein
MDHAVAADDDQRIGSLGDSLPRQVLTLPHVPTGELTDSEAGPAQPGRDLATDARATSPTGGGVDEQGDLAGHRAKGNGRIR